MSEMKDDMKWKNETIKWGVGLKVETVDGMKMWKREIPKKPQNSWDFPPQLAPGNTGTQTGDPSRDRYQRGWTTLISKESNHIEV